MPNNVLYFPYIDVPRSIWFTRTLLYWDRVGVIMPLEFIETPERLHPFTRDLLISGLLTQVFPGHYLSGVRKFSEVFLSYLGSRGAELNMRRRRFEAQSKASRRRNRKEIHLEKLGVIPVHMEKLEGVAEGLINQGLARLTNPPWLSIEAKTAEEFMYYLAFVLGGHKEVQLTPITDQQEKLARLRMISRRGQLDSSLDRLQIEVLEDILPAPNREISVWEIEKFKEKYGSHLSRFRRSVEMELVSLMDIKEAELRKRRLKMFKDGCDEEINELKVRMKESKWPSIVFGRFCALLGAIPIVNQVASPINAAYTALGSGGPKEINSPLAYAAYVQTKLFRD